MEYLFEDGQNLNHKMKSWFKIMKLNEKNHQDWHTLCVPTNVLPMQKSSFYLNNCVCWNKLERKGYDHKHGQNSYVFLKEASTCIA